MTQAVRIGSKNPDGRNPRGSLEKFVLENHGFDPTKGMPLDWAELKSLFGSKNAKGVPLNSIWC
ncbi:MAG: hypothetical protein NPINA01_19380 [Nitrospinaceae bacterium]|nr:MAG: hypothetical protein NPINA01_19380 [Nitrospinaceae bacterium]